VKVKPEKYPFAGIKNGRLTFGGADVAAMAKKFGTPLYLFDEDGFRSRCRSFKTAFESGYGDVLVLFASKSLTTLAALAIASDEGLGLDVASMGELTGAERVGADMSKVVLHGSFKKEEELERAMRAGVGRIVLDSALEADTADKVARRLGAKAKVMLRVTPGIEAHVHEMVQVGKLDSKFGVPLEGGAAKALIGHILKKRNLEFMGIHYHIGSQILETEPFRAAVARAAAFMSELKSDYGLTVRDLNIGGGYPVRYDSAQAMVSEEKFAAAVCGSLKKELRGRNLEAPRLMLEPGRGVAGPAGMTVYAIGPVKSIPGVRNYINVDGGLSDNPRPALYGSVYEAVIAERPLDRKGVKKYRVSGRHCETDTLISEIELPDPKPGETLAVFSTGAYNHSMSGNYNKFPRPATVLLRGGKPEIAVRRETEADLYACDTPPARLMKKCGNKK
jgi:diaminopimelate decarboxylase